MLPIPRLQLLAYNVAVGRDSVRCALIRGGGMAEA
jgi:hypothetical protein